MRKNPRLIGDQHVKLVYEALLKSFNGQKINQFPITVIRTVHFIESLYPNIKSVSSKFDHPNPDQYKDLTLFLDDGKPVTINLFSIKKGGKIQPKNLGAKSFFSKYFLSERLQEMFNKEFEKNYLEFLKELVTIGVGTHDVTNKTELKKLVSSTFKKFTPEINPSRDKFLYRLREWCFLLLRDFYNDKNNGFFHAFNILFMTEDINLITSYGRSEDDIVVEQFNPGTPQFHDIRLYKSGKNTVGIKFGEVALTLRFKFESGTTSSIKLAVSYDRFPDESEMDDINKGTIQKMHDLLHHHEYTDTKNSSNAIGKCHEALTYYYFLKEYPRISQVDADECAHLLRKYYSLVKPKILENLYSSTATIVPVIREKLDEKYQTYQIESIELVPDSYLNDKLDTGDLQLIIRVHDDYVAENISLKAIAKKNAKITTKNPGIGTILGPTYFNIDYDLNSDVNEVKAAFIKEEINHTESLERLAEAIGGPLEQATQEQLRQGLENLLGKAMMAITIYNENISFCKEHSSIDSEVRVYTKTPSAIQNTLTWSNDSESISLRVKFSKGHQHGWSSIKLTSEYQLDPFH
ncbi:hypothetical protein [Niallia sp. Krafla_26]|uniref:hypothetical protein n=1 Tax=Niallia sp. Krafla_26 TaxID=3064703 RepID=UPI003D16C395